MGEIRVVLGKKKFRGESNERLLRYVADEVLIFDFINIMLLGSEAKA